MTPDISIYSDPRSFDHIRPRELLPFLVLVTLHQQPTDHFKGLLVEEKSRWNQIFTSTPPILRGIVPSLLLLVDIDNHYMPCTLEFRWPKVAGPRWRRKKAFP